MNEDLQRTGDIPSFHKRTNSDAFRDYPREMWVSSMYETPVDFEQEGADPYHFLHLQALLPSTVTL